MITVSTTSTLEGFTITNYLDVVNVNIVIGTNVFSDIAASITDFFGGRSGSYQNKLDDLFGYAKKEIAKKAQGLGADAVIALKTDFEEVSGKNKQMVMLSMTGTAVKVEDSSLII